MVDDRVRDGRRLAELLSSELHGRTSGPLGRLSVVDADREVEPTVAGAYAYAVAVDGEAEGEGERVARVYLHPDRIHLAVERGIDAAVDAATEAELRVRPKAVQPPQTLVFVEDGAEVKRATDVLVAVVDALDREESA